MRRAELAGCVALALLAGGALAWAEPPKTASAPALSPAAELDSVREQAVADARAVQDEERRLRRRLHDLDLQRREAEGRQRGLDESRAEQAELLGIIERLARRPPDSVVLGPEAPLDRARGRTLTAATLAELRAEAHALADEIGRVATLHTEVANKEAELARERETVGKRREHLAEIAGHCLELSRKLVPRDAEGAKRFAKLARDAADLTELIKRADAEADRREMDLLARASEDPPKAEPKSPPPGSADPGRPRNLRAFDAGHASLTMPVAGTVATTFGAAEPAETASEGLDLATVPAATVVAPFDAQVIYAGPFRKYGSILILRHGGGYHSVLAGLGRIGAGRGQWVLAGEPLGAMPDAAGDGSGSKLYMEVRRDGRPVDPQPWLANPDQDAEGSAQSGEQRMRE